eukprot:3908677-Rhodomonas_salina.2
MKALRSLNKNDITEIKSFSQPPAVCGTEISDAVQPGVKPTWEDSKKLLTDGTCPLSPYGLPTLCPVLTLAI